MTQSIVRPTASRRRARPLASPRAGTPFGIDLYRRPERLVIDGLRLWARGCDGEDREAWRAAARLYAVHLPHPLATIAIAQLAAWVRAMRAWRPEPLRLSDSGCRDVGRDECLALGLIAAWQHGDAGARAFAAARLGGPAGPSDVAEAAQGLACALQAAGLVLRPISAETLRARHEASASTRLH